MLKIISGGQTGVDRGALDAALASGVPCGGWCPKGRKAEDGIIAKKYPLQELKTGDYKRRTLKNVVESDGTVIIYFVQPLGGTEQTLLFCIEQQKPYLLLDASEFSIARASQRFKQFIQQHKVGVLNIAGPRGSASPDAYSYTKQCLLRCFLESK